MAGACRDGVTNKASEWVWTKAGKLVHHLPSHYLVECTATSIDMCTTFMRLQGEWGSTNAGPYDTMHASPLPLLSNVFNVFNYSYNVIIIADTHFIP
jgi:hypothetical protein